MNPVLRRAPGAALLVAGLALAAFGANELLRAKEPPYRYEVVDAAPRIEDAAVADAFARARLGLRQARVIESRTGATLAELRFGDGSDGPVLFEWRPEIDEPFLTATAPLPETAALAAALRRHVPADAVVLAWWDTSRQLALLAGVQARFDRHVVGAPLALPARWVPQRATIENTESGFWLRGARSADADPRFGAWVDAMLARDDGPARLQRLAGGREAYVVVHVRDALLLGAMAPDRLGVAFRDLPDSGNVHGSISGARDWMRAQGYAAYSAYAPAAGRVRVVALTDAASSTTLVARLLPFHDSRKPADAVPGLTLVHQVGGFWIYRIDEAADRAADRPASLSAG